MAKPGEGVMASDELFLQGRLQLEIARDALRATGANPNFEEKLTTFLGVHADMSTGESQRDLSVYMQGEVVEVAKSDIVDGLKVVRESDVERRVEAEGLLQVLGVEL